MTKGVDALVPPPADVVSIPSEHSTTGVAMLTGTRTSGSLACGIACALVMAGCGSAGDANERAAATECAASTPWAVIGGAVPVTNREFGRDLYLVDREGRAERLTTSTVAYGATPSPDGDYVVYAASRPSDYAGGPWPPHELRRVDVSTGAERTLAPVPAYGGLSFSPDGATIAVSHRVSPEPGAGGRGSRKPPRIALVDVNEPTALRFLTVDLGDDPLARVVEDQNPVFSPDGTRIAFLRGNALVVTPVDGGPSRVVHRSTGWSTGVRWDSDGRHLLLTRPYPGTDGFTSSILRVDTETGESEELLESVPGTAAWSRAADGSLVSAQRGDEWDDDDLLLRIDPQGVKNQILLDVEVSGELVLMPCAL
ncbi:TolB family protein [Vallicoccus soli]|uniref:Lipoprotein LpqB beta-propeller domain-containing protein n=1 Tax=Vallicoccus soli TaxID=2339232 RepID=A0A3A3YQR9_9ACTN|nr:PD40 domain-containing protein [Vallicoccus soli]RJK92983.1 hypothetical protein D5H78_17930 [Vallicoccus soli]